MKDLLELSPNGRIARLVLGGEEIPFRSDGYAGPTWTFRYGGQDLTAWETRERDGRFYAGYFGLRLAHRFELRDGALCIRFQAQNVSSQYFQPDSLGVVLGTDSYMERYPEWDQKLFPTLLRCEKTHFWGYLASPGGRMIGVASPDAVSSWSLCYNQSAEGGGHRVYTFRLDFLRTGKLPQRHPQITELAPGQTREWRVWLFPAAGPRDVIEKAAGYTGAPMPEAQRLTLEPGQEASLIVHTSGQAGAPAVRVETPDGETLSPVTARDGGGQWRARFPVRSTGLYRAAIRGGEKESEALLFCRPEWSWYLGQAGREAIRKKQKTGTHTESWYGFFSGYLAEQYGLLDDPQLDRDFEELLPVAFDVRAGRPSIIPHRIQNTACMAGLLARRYAVRRDAADLELGARLADFLIDDCQTPDGVFRSNGIHYTSVIYIAKSILELVLEERKLDDPIWKDRARRHFNAAYRAAAELARDRDNIGTEGEHTFEDGMISCTIAQLGMTALLLPEGERAPFVEAAEYLLRKHRCLERMSVPDCRCAGSTIRFWEAQYDVLIPSNMQNSPHGWTGWKVYGVWYLYLLTGRAEYLSDLMDTLGSCVQLLDARGGGLRWAFVPDPHIETQVFREDPERPGLGRWEHDTIAEQYVEMISGWYRAPESTPVLGYIGAFEGCPTDQGGSCDNDVHECFKAMAEAALLYCYVIETADGLLAYNGEVSESEGAVVVKPRERLVRAVHVNLLCEREVRVRFDNHERICALRFGWMTRSGEEELTPF